MQYNNVHRQFNLSIHSEYETNKSAAIGRLSTEPEHLQYTYVSAATNPSLVIRTIILLNIF